MDLVLDVGNTETVIGLFRGDQLAAGWRLGSDARRTADEYALSLQQLLQTEGIGRGEVSRMTIASVVPAITTAWSDASRRALGFEAVAITASTQLPIMLDVDEPMTVGADRIVNTLAAVQLYATDTIVVDLGTATTYDCITADGRFIGGVIAPGVRTAADRLTERTAKLPSVALAAPASVIGRRTETCLQSGIFFGAVDAIDGTVRRIREEWQRPEALVVATGGLAPLIGSHCATVQRIEPALTLQGVRLARLHLDRAATPLATTTDRTVHG
jgi:type III pantothenate kinase